MMHWRTTVWVKNWIWLTFWGRISKWKRYTLFRRDLIRKWMILIRSLKKLSIRNCFIKYVHIFIWYFSRNIRKNGLRKKIDNWESSIINKMLGKNLESRPSLELLLIRWLSKIKLELTFIIGLSLISNKIESIFKINRTALPLLLIL